MSAASAEKATALGANEFNPRQLVSSGQLGEVLGMTERRVQQLEAEGILTNVGKGRSKRYELSEAVQAIIARSEASFAAANSVSTSRELFEAERARKLKFENDQREALLIDQQDALAAIDRIFGEVRTGLAGIAAKVTDDVAYRRKIDDAIDITLADIANRLDQSAAALREGRDPLAADD